VLIGVARGTVVSKLREIKFKNISLINNTVVALKAQRNVAMYLIYLSNLETLSVSEVQLIDNINLSFASINNANLIEVRMLPHLDN
jgi:hypothetical protein